MDIKIVDNFLDKIDFKKVNESYFNKKWEMQQSSSRPPYGLDFLIHQVSSEKFFDNYLFNKIKQHLEGEYEIERIYFNGQWPGREGAFHSDNCDITALLYVSPYEYGWGGFTEILTSSTEPPTLVHPLQNRLLLFPGRIVHKGYSFSYQSCPLRVSLAYKLITK